MRRLEHMMRLCWHASAEACLAGRQVDINEHHSLYNAPIRCHWHLIYEDFGRKQHGSFRNLRGVVRSISASRGPMRQILLLFMTQYPPRFDLLLWLGSARHWKLIEREQSYLFMSHWLACQNLMTGTVSLGARWEEQTGKGNVVRNVTFSANRTFFSRFQSTTVVAGMTIEEMMYRTEASKPNRYNVFRTAERRTTTVVWSEGK